jgi:hypothetical protein
MAVFLAALAVAIGIPVLVNRWITRRKKIDDYYEREHRDPPVLTKPGGGPSGF